MNISIAMATYNGEKYIKEQLQSLSNQTSLPFELVVGDDGSTDATLDILKEFCAHAPFPVRIHQNQANLGFARNFLDTARRCKGDWIAFCDQDDVWLPDKLATVIQAIEHTPNCRYPCNRARSGAGQFGNSRQFGNPYCYCGRNV